MRDFRRLLVACSIGVLLGGLAAARPSAAETRTVVLNPVADSTLLRTQPSTHANFGSDPALEVRNAGRAVVRFDLSSLVAQLGPEAAVESAALQVNAMRATGWPAAGADVSIFRLDAEWVELATTWACPVDSDLSNNRADCPVRWNGAEFLRPATASVRHSDATSGLVAFDVLADVRDFVTGARNTGWVLKLDGNLTSPLVRYGARESGADGPRLAVSYDTDAVAPALKVLAPASYFVLGQARPALVFAFSDGGSGIAPGGFRLSLDDQLITASCEIEATGATCTPPADLLQGVHQFAATVTDLDGNQTTVGGSFDLLLTAGPHTRILEADADAFIEPTPADRNNGADANLTLTGGNRGLVHFDLASFTDLGAQTTVEMESALLRLYVNQALRLPPGGRAVDVHELTAGWVEPEVTWNCPADEVPGGQTTCTTPWNGGSFVATPESSVTIAERVTGYRDWPVTNSVRRRLAPPPGTAANLGWLLQLAPGSASNERVRLGSRDRLPKGQQPFLRLVFRLPELADQTPPVVNFLAPPPLVINNPRPTVQLSFSDAGGSGVDVASFQLRLDGTDLTGGCAVTATGAQCVPTADLAAGAHKLDAQLADGAGNVATASFAFSLVLDLVPPTIVVTAPVGTILNDPTPTVTVTYDDVGVGVDAGSLVVTLDGTALDCAVGPGVASCGVGAPLAAGDHTLNARIADLTGNVATATGTFRLILDAAQPTLTITAPPSTVINDATPELRVEYDDGASGLNLATLVVAVDGSVVTCSAAATSATCEPPALAAGTHTVTARIADLAGNVANASATFELILDAVAPEVTITEPPARVINDPTPAVVVTYSDAGAGLELASLEVRLDGAVVTCSVAPASATCEPPPLAPGDHTVSARIEDVAGNAGTATATFALILDADAPTVVITAPPAAVLNDDTPEVRVAYSDAGAGLDLASLTVTLDGSPLACVAQADSATCEPSVLAAGSHTVEAQIADEAGNLGEATATFELVLDTTAPSLAITAPTGSTTDNTPTVTVEYADPGTGVDLTTLQIAIDGVGLVCPPEAITPSGASCEAPELAVGSHTVTAQIADRAANLANATGTFTVQQGDVTPPALGVTTPVDPLPIGETQPLVTVIFSDDGSGIEPSSLRVRVDTLDLTAGCTVSPTGATCPTPVLAAGSHTASAEVSDRVGNRATAARSFVVRLSPLDSTPPSLTITAPPTVVNEAAPAIVLSYSDSGSGIDVASVAVRLDEVSILARCAVGPTGTTCTSPSLSQGDHNLVAEVRDLAGNRTTATRTFLVDLGLVDDEAPTITISQPVGDVVVDDATPTVVVDYADSGSGVAVGSFRLQVDAVDVTVRCTVGGSSATCEAPPLAPGDHTFSATISDLAGNPASATRTLTIAFSNPEEEPPVVAILTPAGTVVDDPTPAVEVSYSDGGSAVVPESFLLFLDGRPVTTCTAGATSASCVLPPTPAGTHQLSATVSDVFGNQGSANISFVQSFSRVDNAPPAVAFVTPGPAVVDDPAPRFEILIGDAGTGLDLATARVTLDGVNLEQFCTVTAEQIICNPEPLARGSHQAQAQVRDLAGNLGTATRTFDLSFTDTVVPNLAVVSPAASPVIGDLSPQLAFTFTDDASGVVPASLVVLLDGSDLTARCAVGETQAACSPAADLAEGSHNLVAQVEDRAGNRASVTFPFELFATVPDRLAPTVTVTQPAAATLVEGAAFGVVAAFADDLSGVDPATVVVTLDGTNVTSSCVASPAGVSCALPLPAVGPHGVQVALADRAGNSNQAGTSFTVVAETEAPVLDITTPDGGLVRGDATPTVVVQFADRGVGIDPASLEVAVNGASILPSCTVEAGTATCAAPFLNAGVHTVTAAVSDLRGNRATDETRFELTLELQILIETPAQGLLTQATTIDVTGVMSLEAESVVVGETVAVLGTGEGVGTFTAFGVPLEEGGTTLTAIARTLDGGVGTHTITVVRDTLAPDVEFRTPLPGTVTTTQQIFITGEFNDPLSSNVQLLPPTVTVNGVAAAVENRTFAIESFLLQPGENLLEVVVTDAAGNVGRAETRVTLAAEGVAQLEELLGNGQFADAGEPLANPLIVRLKNGLGGPLPGRQVVFEVVRGTGLVRAGTEEGAKVTVTTDEFGIAQATFTLGERLGSGNHEVRASSPGVTGGIVFCASANTLPPRRIVRVLGDNQTGVFSGVAGTPYQKPLLSQVFDERGNPVEGVQVTYRVLVGNGHFGGLPEVTTLTDGQGIASVEFVLGTEVGNAVNVVTAEFPGQSEIPAMFTISGSTPGAEPLTSVVGIVLDNEDQPVPGATIAIHDTPLTTLSGADGRFVLNGAPVGTIHLDVGGGTVTRPGTWPDLGFEMVTISGQANDLGMPIRLLPIDVAGSKIVGGDEDVVISMDGVPGAQITVYANSVTFPDGSHVGRVSFTQVHGDKVPMVAPMGSTFALAFTVQPPRTLFDPPARIQIPNQGMPPGSVVDIFSFDHDLGEFVSAGAATVTADGMYLVSNPGFGVRKAGWHGCTTPPPPTGDGCNPGACTTCGPNGPESACDECSTCTGSGCRPKSLEEVTATATAAGGQAAPRVERALTVLDRLRPPTPGQVRFAAGGEEDERVVTAKDKNVQFNHKDLRGSCGSGSPKFMWDFGDGETAEGASATHAYEEEGTYTATLSVSCEDCPSSIADSIEVKVIKVNIEIQSLPEEDESEPHEEEPGALVPVNNDDDNTNQTIDDTESGVSGDDELEEVKLEIDQSLDKGEVKLEALEGSDRIKIWEDQGKTREIQLPKTWDLAQGRAPQTVYLEFKRESPTRAAVPGQTSLQLSYQAQNTAPIKDKAVAKPIEVDVDVDSDNNNGYGAPARTNEEDQFEDVENDAARPGKVIFVNRNDDDMDNVLDYADGFNFGAGAADDINSRDQFPQMVIKLSEGVDLTKAKIKITYAESPPSVVRSQDYTHEPGSTPVTQYWRDSGQLRIWTTAGNTSRNRNSVTAGGHFVGMGEFTAAQLGFTGSTREKTFYLEATGRSGQAADLRILVEVDPDGPGQAGFDVKDAVRLTAMTVELRDTNGTHQRQEVEGGDMALVNRVPQMPQLTVGVLPTVTGWDGQCQFFVEFDRTPGVNPNGTPDQRQIPAGGGRQTVTAGTTWNLAATFGADFFGGDAYIDCTFTNLTWRHNFRMRGQNPEDTAARAYIDAQLGPLFRYSYAIAKHETRFGTHRYHQFGLTRAHGSTTNGVLKPILGPPDGWGIKQNDFSGDNAPRRFLTQTELWNWQANVDRGRAIMQEKVNIADRLMNSMSPTGRNPCTSTPVGQRNRARVSGGGVYVQPPHTGANCPGTAPGTWQGGAVPPYAAMPNHTDGACTIVDGAGGTMTFDEASVAKCYNGCGTNYITWNGNAWVINVGQNNYVNNVCREI